MAVFCEARNSAARCEKSFGGLSIRTSWERREFVTASADVSGGAVPPLRALIPRILPGPGDPPGRFFLRELGATRTSNLGDKALFRNPLVDEAVHTNVHDHAERQEREQH